MKKKPSSKSGARKAAKVQRRRRRTAGAAAQERSARQAKLKDLQLTPAGRYALFDPSDPGWASFEDPEGFRAAVHEADLDDAGWDRWLQ